LGQTDEAIEWLNKAYESRSSELTILKVLPGIEDLREDPRFHSLLRKLGLE
jgi:hypothetical protein